MKNRASNLGFRVILSLILAMAWPSFARAHCDSLDGPVVVEARIALETKDVTPLLKWVRPEDESAIRDAFAKTVAVRELGEEAKDLADTYFLETLVRIHRAGEGAPYTGLKPAGGIEPAIAKADRALDEGSVDALATAVARHTAEGIRERFATALEARKHAAESITAGREYIDAYVNYVHYVESIATAAHGMAHHDAAHEGP